MPKRNKSSKPRKTSKGPGISSQMGRTVRIPFNFVYAAPLTAAISRSLDVSVSSAFDTLLSNIGANFEYYRFTRLMFKAIPNATTFAMTYYPSNESSSVSDTFASVSFAALNRVVGQSQTVPVSLVVPSSLLYQSPEDWWSTSSGGGVIRTQGRFVFATPATQTASYYFQVMGICEFKAPSAQSSDLKVSNPSNQVRPADPVYSGSSCCTSTGCASHGRSEKDRPS